MTGHELLAQLEDHCGAKVEDRRLRFQITSTFDRLTQNNESMVKRIQAVLGGADTFDPQQQKVISRPEREK